MAKFRKKQAANRETRMKYISQFKKKIKKEGLKLESIPFQILSWHVSMFQEENDVISQKRDNVKAYLEEEESTYNEEMSKTDKTIKD